MAPRVAFVTSAEHPDGTDDDLLVARSLGERGIDLEVAVWDRPTVDWSGYDLVVLRSTWDYFRRYSEFLLWVRKCATTSRLWNPLEMAVWNSDKSYLFDLEAEGVPVIPTERATPDDTLEEICGRRGWDDVVVKGVVGAAAYGAHFVSRADRSAFEPKFARALSEGGQLVQPFVRGVLDPGERSLVYIDGRFSHAFSKGPALPVDRRQEQGYRPVEVDAAALRVAERALARRTPRPLYARVDLVVAGDGSPMLMELELIEPYLHFQGSAHAADRFADAIRDRL